MKQEITDVIFADEGGARSAFVQGFAWGCATSAGLGLVIIVSVGLLGR